MSNKGYFSIDPIVLQELKDRWLLLTISFILVIISFSLPAFAPQNIYDYLERDFGWSQQEITLLPTAKYFMGALTALFVGFFIDRVGLKSVLIIVSVVGAIAMSSFKWMPSLTVFYSVGLLLGIATTGTIVALKVLIGRGFDYAQGFAMGFCLMGMSVGQGLVPYLIAFFVPETEAFAWQSGMFTLSLGIWLIAIPLMFFGLSEKNLTPRPRPKHAADEKLLGFKDIMVDKRFWLIAMAVFLAGFVDQSFIQNARFMLKRDLGLDELTYAHIFTIYAIAGAISRPLLGILIDRISVKGVALTYTLLGASCLMALPLSAAAPLTLYFFMLLRGFGHSGVMLDSAMLSKHCYGTKNLGLLIGILTAFINIGFATGPFIMSVLFDAFGSWGPVFIIYFGLSMVAMGIVLMVKPTFWLAAQEDRKLMPLSGEKAPA